MLLLGIDLGTSSVKVSVLNAADQKVVASAHYPKEECPILVPKPGWAEQPPDQWWENTQHAIHLCHKSGAYDPKDIVAIGIAYQMHGLVIVDKNQQHLRNSIIWCDSRAVEIGNTAFSTIGQKKCLENLLNSPGNFTSSKLAWVKQNEPEVYQKVDKFMLPGDFIAMKLSGVITTSVEALSEGIFFDFKTRKPSEDVINYFGFAPSLFPPIADVFSTHGHLKPEVANQLGLKPGIVISYKSGDQPNNALSLNVLNPGEVASTAGTSGVIYGVTDQLIFDPKSRVNTFAHVNYTAEESRLGVLMCINGVGSMYRWLKQVLFSPSDTYQDVNAKSREAPVGSQGLCVLPFGNGGERMLENRTIGTHFHNIDLNIHHKSHMARAVQEGIAFSFRYGLDIMRENGMHPTVIRAGKSNLFLSDLFVETFVNITGLPVELYKSDGSIGAAIGAGIGAKVFKQPSDAFQNFQPLDRIEPNATLGAELEKTYAEWKRLLENQIEYKEKRK
ncbi:xylulose kinase [Ditylenchus destructor]|nr:xylulose kinase [Ditylenchus destructor]